MTREKVAVALVKFDEGKTDFQIAQVVGARAIDQFKVFELRYIRGNNDTEGYLAKQSELDKVKANTYGSWGKMRRFLRSASLSLFEIKLLVLGVSIRSIYRGKSYSGTHDKPKELRAPEFDINNHPEVSPQYIGERVIQAPMTNQKN